MELKINASTETPGAGGEIPAGTEVKEGAQGGVSVTAGKTPPAGTTTPPAEKTAAEKKPEGTTPPGTVRIETPKETPKIDLSAAVSEFGKDGKLSDATYDSFEKKGLARADVDAMIAGHQSKVQGVVTALTEVAGGADSLKSLMEWAGTNTDAETRDAFNAAMDSANTPVAKAILRGLLAEYNDTVGVEGDRVLGSKVGTGVKPYANWNQVRADMSKKDYQNDPAFRETVSKRLAASNF